MRKYIYCMKGIVYKELVRFIKQKSRFFSALVRPLLWLFVFSIGFKSVLTLEIIEPYENYITYETYIIPGLVGMILLFNGMQSSLTMIFDREMGSMKILLTSYINRNYLLFCKMFATAIVSTFKAITFLIIAKIYGIEISYLGIFVCIPVIMVCSLILNAFALFISSVVKQLENFATVMNFVIFPIFFLSSALYPLSRFKESSLSLFNISSFNPFTYIVEFIRYSLYLEFDSHIFFVISLSFVIVLNMAFVGFKLKKVNNN